jgi:hypothetical protein
VLHWLDYPNQNPQAMLAFRLVLLVVVTNNSRSMQTSINGPNKILQTSTEALNLGRSSQRWSASPLQAMIAFRLVLLVVITNNSRTMQKSINGPNKILQTSTEALNLG